MLFQAAPAVLDRLNSLLEPDGFLLPGSLELSEIQMKTAVFGRRGLQSQVKSDWFGMQLSWMSWP